MTHFFKTLCHGVKKILEKRAIPRLVGLRKEGTLCLRHTRMTDVKDMGMEPILLWSKVRRWIRDGVVEVKLELLLTL